MIFVVLREQIKDAMKATKASVDYSRGTYKEHCGICEHYSDHTCSKVQGTIEPDYWCKLYEPKG